MIKVKPKIGEVGAIHSPLILDKYQNPITLLYMGIIKDIDQNGDILIEGAPVYFPDWRMEWYTFGGVPVQNPKYNVTKIENENTLRYNKLIKALKTKKSKKKK